MSLIWKYDSEYPEFANLAAKQHPFLVFHSRLYLSCGVYIVIHISTHALSRQNAIDYVTHGKLSEWSDTKLDFYLPEFRGPTTSATHRQGCDVCSLRVPFFSLVIASTLQRSFVGQIYFSHNAVPQHLICDLGAPSPAKDIYIYKICINALHRAPAM